MPDSFLASRALWLLLALLPSLIVYVWTALALARVYAKLGVAGWKAWVPVYNAAVFLRLGGRSPWLLLLYLIPVFGALFVYVAIVISAHRIGTAFGYGGGMTVLAALLFPVWASILGFGPAQPEPAPDAAAFGAVAAASQSAAPPLDGGQPLFDARRDLAAPSAWIPPAPSAWIPPAPEAPVDSAPAAAPEPTPPAAVAAPAPAAEPTPTEPVVTSWWMPAPEAEPAPEPVRRVPPAAAAPAPAPETRAVLREAYVPESDAFPEDSGAVSAVIGSPTAGAPRAAVSAVSAFRPGMGEFVEDTVIAARKRPAWSLRLPDGTLTDLTGDAAVLGRRPAPVHSAPAAQLVIVEEETRTVSKTHALLRRQGETWTISDLSSTNGVMVDGAEVEPGVAVAIDGPFLLGDAEVQLTRRRP